MPFVLTGRTFDPAWARAVEPGFNNPHRCYVFREFTVLENLEMDIGGVLIHAE
jgi:hypothetical protein